MLPATESRKSRRREKAGSFRAHIAVWILTASLMPAYAQKQGIDVQRSVFTVHVYKGGLFSAFAGHDHEITAPVARGYVERTQAPSVELWVDSAKLRVIDSDLSPKDRAEVQATMEGPEVLDVRRFPEIHFRSTAVEQAGMHRWIVRGELDLHGQTRPVAAEITEKEGWFEGSLTLKQRDFGIKPVSIAGGTVRVKDQVRIDLRIAVAP